MLTMSSYVNFYLRVNENFAPIGSFSRNNEVYQYIYISVPYGKIRPITHHDFSEFIKNINQDIGKYEKYKLDQQEEIRRAMSLTDRPIDEIMEYVHKVEFTIQEEDKIISELKYAQDVFIVYQNMIDDARYSDLHFDNDCDHYIYAGVEACGRMEDVVE